MNGCWDWIGWYGADFDVKSGKQSTAMKKMIDRVTAGFNPIGAPTGLQVTDTKDNSISLLWNQVSTATGYNLYRNGAKVNSEIISSTTYTDNNLNSGSTYTYTVKALSSSGTESTSSNSVTGRTTGEPPAIQTPNGLTATDITSNSVTLTWESAAGADIYRLYRDGSQIADVTLLSYKDSDLKSSTEYKYQVSSVKGSVESDKSLEIKVSTLTVKQCFNDNNYNHVTAGRAYQTLGMVYANGSDQMMGLYNIFIKTNLCMTKENHYVIE
jgi:hypothetical protein